MMRRFRVAALAGLGLLVLVPSALFLATITPTADYVAAHEPLQRVPVDEITQRRSLPLKLVIPDTPQWRRMRQAWGEPLLRLRAARNSSCLTDFGITVEFQRRGQELPPEADWGGCCDHLPTCAGASLWYRKEFGEGLMAIVARQEDRPWPPGGLIVFCKWRNEKDQSVERSIEEALRKPAIAALLAGMGLLGLAWRVNRVSYRAGADE